MNLGKYVNSEHRHIYKTLKQVELNVSNLFLPNRRMFGNLNAMGSRCARTLMPLNREDTATCTLTIYNLLVQS